MRLEKGIVYPRSEVALRHGAGVEVETTSPAEAYAPFPKWQLGPPASWAVLRDFSGAAAVALPPLSPEGIGSLHRARAAGPRAHDQASSESATEAANASCCPRFPDRARPA